MQNDSLPDKPAAQETFVEGLDFYFDDNGLMVLTRRYLTNRGFCCENGCQHCPYDTKALAAS